MKPNAKIAQLPKDIRTLINYYLYLNHPGKKILSWLNKLPEVKTLVAERSEGRPLNGQNLAEWKKGGYKEWHREFTADSGAIFRDPVLRRSYLSLLQSYIHDAHVRLQRDLVRYILECLQKQAQAEKDEQVGRPAPAGCAPSSSSQISEDEPSIGR